MPGERTVAFVEDLAARQSEHLWRFLRTRVRNTADIPDIIQETFLRLLRVPNVDTIRAPEAYIFTIAYHVAREHGLRAAANHKVALDDVLSELFAPTDSDPELQANAQQCVRTLDSALQELSVKTQFVFLAYRRDGLSMDEISERLNISRPMAKKYVAQALVHMRRRLKETE